MATDRHIKRFQLELIVKDSGDLARQLDKFQKLIEDDMEVSGYIPVLDLGVHIAALYDPKKEEFHYRLTEHGIYVGKRKACLYVGLVGNKMLMKQQTTQEIKSEQS